MPTTAKPAWLAVRFGMTLTRSVAAVGAPTNQSTAAVGMEPLSTLARYRMNAELGGVTFGMNAVVAAGAGLVIHRGDRASCAFRFLF